MTQSLGVPRAYVRMLCELEDFLNKTLAGAAGRRSSSRAEQGQLALAAGPECGSLAAASSC